jgi:hypothetical protein
MSVATIDPSKEPLAPRPWRTRMNYLHPRFTVNEGSLVHHVYFDFHYLFSSERSQGYLREDKNGIFRDIECAMREYFHPTPEMPSGIGCAQTQPKEEPRTNNGHPRGTPPMFDGYHGWEKLFDANYLIWLQLTFATVEARDGKNSFSSHFGDLDTFLREEEGQEDSGIIAFSQPSPLSNMAAGFDVIANKKTGELNVKVNLDVVKVLGFNLKGIMVYKPNANYDG